MFDAAGAEAEMIDLDDYEMPIYDGDWEDEHDQPDTAVVLTERLRSFDGLIFVTPEHNGGPSALLKNTIDWITRVDRGAFKPLLIGLAAASPGRRGGVNGLAAMQHIVEHMRLDLAPNQLTISSARDAFEIGGEGPVRFVREDDRANAQAFVDSFVATLALRSAAD